MTESDRRGTAGSVDDAAVEHALRSALRSRDADPALSSFDAVFGNAQRLANRRADAGKTRTRDGDRRPRPAYLRFSYGLLVAVVMVVLLEPWRPSEMPVETPTGFGLAPDDAAARQLVAELTRATHWRAPSDRLLASDRMFDAGRAGMGLPDFGGMKFKMQETLPWPELET